MPGASDAPFLPLSSFLVPGFLVPGVLVTDLLVSGFLFKRVFQSGKGGERRIGIQRFFFSALVFAFLVLWLAALGLFFLINGTRAASFAFFALWSPACALSLGSWSLGRPFKAVANGWL